MIRREVIIHFRIEAIVVIRDGHRSQVIVLETGGGRRGQEGLIDLRNIGNSV